MSELPPGAGKSERREKKQAGRIAFRTLPAPDGGDWWVAYYALPDTMEGAIELARIRMEFVRGRKRKDAFMEMMRGCVGDILEERVGAAPHWRLQPPPEHERKNRQH